jgi:pyrroloquinoline-quinone synthase
MKIQILTTLQYACLFALILYPELSRTNFREDMTNFATELKNELLKKSILNHPFYQAWNEGKLSKEALVEYSKQYFHHVQNFPQCLSALHSKCNANDMEARQIILENLIEEEQGEKNHPAIWLQYAEGLGVKEKDVRSVGINNNTKNLMKVFTKMSSDSYETGLGALYAHEFQYHEIADTKKKGLKEFYGVKDDKSLEFFTIHGQIDIWHSEQLEKLLNKLPESSRAKVRDGAHKAIDALWGFLDGMMPYCGHA